MEPVATSSLNLLLRGGSVMLLALMAALLWRAQRRKPAARLGAGFAIGVAAATLAGAPGFGALPALPRVVISGVAAGSMFVFWLFTRALLDDGFALRRWHGAVWAVLAGLGVLACLSRPPLAAPLAWTMGLSPVFWSLLAIVQSLAHWREDLVEGRRRLRAVIVAATALYTIGQLVAALLIGVELRTIVESSANAAGTAALTAFFAWQLLQWRGSVLFEEIEIGAKTEAVSAPPATSPPPDARQVATLQSLMTVQRVYREPSLTVAALALRMGLPEHRLRRLINQGLGHRHFSAFLNAYRIGDAKQALADPRQADVPVLTIAMDVGFQSIGPFNRAFKADTGLTPTEFRRSQVPRAADPVAVDTPEHAET
jgi:AraC-like DNA-binding protein